MSPRGQVNPALCAEKPSTGIPFASKKLNTGMSNGNATTASLRAFGD
jgi:hypothetical protein